MQKLDDEYHRRVTLTEAAAILGVTPDTLRQQIANGKLTAVKHGRDWWITEHEVGRYARESKGRIGRRARPT